MDTFFINSIPGQFMMGGLTVSGISVFSNNLNNPLLSGIVASIPVGMPSSIFIKDSQLPEYSWNLLVMTSVLYLSTFINWYLITKEKMSKYESVQIAMSVWVGLGIIYYFIVKMLKKSQPLKV